MVVPRLYFFLQRGRDPEGLDGSCSSLVSVSTERAAFRGISRVTLLFLRYELNIAALFMGVDGMMDE